MFTNLTGEILFSNLKTAVQILVGSILLVSCFDEAVNVFTHTCRES